MSSLPSLPAGMSGHPPTAPTMPSESNPASNKLTEIVNFWKLKKQHWFQPSDFVKSFQHVFDALVHVRDLELKADVALERLFAGGAVEYIYGTGSDVGLPGENIDITYCRWPGSKWVIQTGHSKEEARKSAAYEALKIILGSQFDGYCTVSASSNYVGFDAEELRLALLTAGLNTEGSMMDIDDPMENNNIAAEPAAVATGSNTSDRMEAAVLNEDDVFTFSFISDHFPSELAGDILDANILTWRPENWKNLSKTEKDEILFQFWAKTSSETFPFTMNLVRTRYPFAKCALGAFMLLFSEGQKIHKQGVEWKHVNAEDGGIEVKLTWRDPSEKYKLVHHHVVTGSRLDDARGDAAKQALETIYTGEGMKILEHACQGFFFQDSFSSEKDNREALHKRLKEAKKKGVVSTNSVPPSGSTKRKRSFSSDSDGRKIAVRVSGRQNNRTKKPKRLGSAAPQLAARNPVQVVNSQSDISSSTMEEAPEKAAEMALKALQDSSD